MDWISSFFPRKHDSVNPQKMYIGEKFKKNTIEDGATE